MDSKEKKSSFSERVEQFAAGRGYYGVLAVCAVVIGVSVWSLLRPSAFQQNGASASSVVAPVPAQTPVWTPEPDASALEPQEAAESPVPQETDGEMPEDEAAETVAQDAFVMPVNGTLQRPYSITVLAYDDTMRDWRTHDGVDFAAEAGEKVYAVTSGTVTQVFADDRYGTTVEIDHGNGLVCTYAGLQEIPTVSVGDTVAPGDTIGAVGLTCLCEAAQGAHLHLSAMRNGESISPMEFLPSLS